MKTILTHLAAYFFGGVVAVVVVVATYQEKLTDAKQEIEALRRTNASVYSNGYSNGFDVGRRVEQLRLKMEKEDDAVLVQQLEALVQDLQNRVGKLEADAKLPPPPK